MPEINFNLLFQILLFSAPSVYAAQELLDFGIVRTFDEPKKLPVNLINTGRNAVQITVSRKNEPPRGKTNNVVSEQVRHKPACTSTEKS